VQEAVQIKLQVREELSDLKAEYVRDYIQSVLELCPTDYFILAPDGDWVVDPEHFASLPQRVKRLVEGVELKYIGGRRVLSVKFISKASVLAMAARYTLTQTVHATVSQIPWDQVTEDAAVSVEDALEAYAASRAAGSVRDGTEALAERKVLPGTA
jgi:hypothetical protein